MGATLSVLLPWHKKLVVFNTESTLKSHCIVNYLIIRKLYLF